MAKFFFCVFMDRDEVEVHKLAKKERGQYPTILTERTWSIKDLLYGFWGNFACGIQRVVPSGHLARSGSQSLRAIWFILPARWASHIITWSKVHTLKCISYNQVVIYPCTLASNIVHVCCVFFYVAPCDLIKDKTTCQVHFNSSDCVWNDSTSSCLGPERCVQPKISGETVEINRKSEPDH